MITNSKIAYGDKLGAQMSSFANLFFLSKENNQQIVFYNELINFRRKILFLDVFKKNDNFKILPYKSSISKKIANSYCRQFDKTKNWESEMNRIYNNLILTKIDRFFLEFIRRIHGDFKIIDYLQNDVNCDSSLLRLDKNINYDINNGFGTYQDWKKYEKEIVQIFDFKDKIIDSASKQLRSINSTKEKVSIHFRRTDYLVMASYCLKEDYYRKALSMFDNSKNLLFVFSDDIEWAKKQDIFLGYETYFVEGNDPSLDMCLMSLCDSNIIANSSFSFWGAFLNKNIYKKVVCPINYVSINDSTNSYLNSNYYPKEWIAI